LDGRGEAEEVGAGFGGGGGHVEDEDEDGDGVEDVGALVGEVGFDEGVLTVEVEIMVSDQCCPLDGIFQENAREEGSPSAVPEIQHEVAHELDITVLDVDGRA
jgi:hypothetical protein